MTEAEARDWLAVRYPAERIGKLERFVAMLAAEAQQQSLIARSTFQDVWVRHIVDSAQLIGLVPPDGNWLDIGSGGGLPGLVVGILSDRAITLSEPRRKRAAFLRDVADLLGLRNVTVEPVDVQRLSGTFGVVSARAVAAIPDLFDWTRSVVSRETHFVLPRGRNWQQDLALAQRAWHGRFHVEHSITDPSAGIIVARQVAAR